MVSAPARAAGIGEDRVGSVFDWITIATFGGLAVLYLQRSIEGQPRDKIWHYLPPAIGCAVVNEVGNDGYSVLGVAGIVAVLAWIYHVLKPGFRR